MRPSLPLPSTSPLPTEQPARPGYCRGPHWAAVVAAVLTFPLLLVGGTVTTYGVGMAVPDWPTTFGVNMFVYDFWNAAWGVFIEHTHRLYAFGVGVLTVLLAVWFQVMDRRSWMKGLGWLAVAVVGVQGILGGFRVRLNSIDLAAVHGCIGLAFFGLLVALCVLTGRRWFETGSAAPDPEALRRRAVTMLVLIYVQVVVGAWLRHHGAGLIVHALIAPIVLGYAVALFGRIERSRARVPGLVPASRALALAAVAQVVLGVGAWWMLRPFDGIPKRVTTYQAMVRTAHQSNAALLLGASVVLSLRAFRTLTAPSGAAADVPTTVASSPPSNLEVVA